MDVLDSKHQEAKRKKKDQKRREVKDQRKGRLQEKSHQQQLKKGEVGAVTVDPQKLKEKKILKQREEANKDLITDDLMKEMSFAQKITMITTMRNDLIAFPAFRYKQLKDLLKLCGDQNPDVVLKSTTALCDVFEDILPSYRIRQSYEEGENSKNVKISKDVEQLRNQEQGLLNSYKEYLQVLEVFMKLKQSGKVYERLRQLTIQCFSRLIERHPHFNFRLNIMQAVVFQLTAKDLDVRQQATKTVKSMLRKDDNQLLDFKLDVIKELHKILKSKPHMYFDPSLLDCLVLHEIIVDEGKAKAVDASTKKQTQMHDQMQKLRKKGKFKEYKEMKDQLMTELKETDAIGLDLGKVSSVNNEIIKETLAVYFSILKQQQTSPLLRSVFLGLPQFSQYVNVEIVWDLISVLREYFKVELNSTKEQTRDMGMSNILAGLLCAFQILEVGAGTTFNVDERDFLNALYTVLQRMYEQPRHPRLELKDYIALLKVMEIVFLKRKQLSAETVNAFVKRLSILQMHMMPNIQASTLFFIKQVLNRYPSARSQMLEIETDAVGGGFSITPVMSLYRAELNDPQLSNAGQTHAVFEFLHTFGYWNNHAAFSGRTKPPRVAALCLKLIKSIIMMEDLPQDLLTETPSKILAELYAEDDKSLLMAE